MRSKSEKAAYDMKYKKERLVQYVIDLPPQTKSRWQEAAKLAGTSLRRYIIDAVELRVQREELESKSPG